MRKVKIPTWCFLLLLFIGLANAQTRGVGLGFYGQIGNTYERGGLDAKLWFDAIHALDVNLTIDASPLFADGGMFAYYQFHYWNALPVQGVKIPLYWGIGGGAMAWESGWGLRAGALGGASICFPTAPLDIYLQTNPLVGYHSDNKRGTLGGLHPDLLLQVGMRFFVGG